MERISALMDGEAPPLESRQTIAALNADGDCRQTWECFHLIGDVMRGERALSDEFAARLHARIAKEPTQLAPRAWRTVARGALTLAASLCAIAIVAALVFVDNPLRPQTPVAAAPKAETAVVARDQIRPVVPAQGKVREYLMAHQEFSHSTALQGVAPYVRTVSEPHDGNGR